MKKSNPTKKEGDKVNIKSDFKQFFIAETGSSIITSAEFEQVSASDSSESSDDFKEQDEEVEEKGIKTFQFWNGIKLPKDAPKPTNDSVQWKISCPFSFGFNSLGRDNIIYIDGEICKAFGSVLILNNKIYTKHNKKITTLAFSENSTELLSATESPSPQFFLWEYDSEQKTLEFKRRFVVGSKSEDIYSVSFFQQNFVVCVELFTLHKSSTIHCFQKSDGIKRATFKVGKFYDWELLNSQEALIQEASSQNQDSPKKDRLFYSNDEGIWELMCQQQDNQKPALKIEKIHESNNICCLLPFYDQKDLDIMYGDKQGNINLVFSKESLKVHDGWIFELKHYQRNGKNYFFALGAMDLKLSLFEYSGNKIKLLKKLQLGGYGRSIHSDNDMLLIGKRDGDYEEFSLNQLIDEKKQDKITSNKTNSLKCFESKQKKREFFIEVSSKQKSTQSKTEYPVKSYVYGHSRSKAITFFTISNKKMENTESYALRYYPQSLDISSNTLAYAYFVEKDQEGQKTGDFTKSTFKSEKKVHKLVLVVEEVSTKNLLAKIPIETNSQKKSSLISVNVKFSPSGNFIAVSDSLGGISILPKSQKENRLFLQQLIKSDKQTHKEPIQQITWSKNQQFIKTISQTELYYWEVSLKEGSETKLLAVKSSQITEVVWNAISKFGWETKNVWESTDLVGDIYKFWSQGHTNIDVVQTKVTKQVQATKKNIIGCVRSDGSLRIYNYPAKGSQRKEIRINNEAFEVCPYWASSGKFSFVVVIEGMIALVELHE